MRNILIAFYTLVILVISNTAYAQDCPLLDSDWDRGGRDICEAIFSFNQQGIPGVVASDDDDDCDDDDPTWMPTPPFSAIIIIGSWGTSIINLDERLEEGLRRSINNAGIIGNYGTNIPSLDNGFGSPDLSEFRYLAQHVRGVENAISRGDLVYYYMDNNTGRY